LLASADSLRDLLPRRKFSAYKNQFGRVGVVAGSKGLTGAAILCVSGALRGGAGLVELLVSEDIYAIVAASAPPEVMVKPIRSYAALLDEKIDVWAVGPGLGRAHAPEISKLIAEATQPMVIDADGLNIASDNLPILRQPAGPRLLTPHPGEMSRLFASEGISRLETATRFCAEFPVTLLLKGSRTIVSEHGCAASYNTTGTPGMATGGMGDVLTGVCAALIGQQLTPYDAARLGAWVCGRAAEIAIFNGNASEESLLPTDVLANLGAAFHDLQNVHH
jgi:NAD(P)H-hydrate epimerase